MINKSMNLVTVVYRNVPLLLEGYYWEGSPMVMYYPDGSGHPGDPAQFEIVNVWVQDTNIVELLHDNQFEELETAAIDIIEN